MNQYVDEDVYIVSDTEFLATITIEKMEKREMYYPVNSLTIENLKENYKSVYTNFDPLKLEIWGSTEKLQELEVASISASIDLSSIDNTGNYTVPVKITLPDGYNIFDEYTVAVYVYEGNLEYTEMTSQNQSQSSNQEKTTVNSDNDTGESEEE